MRPLGCWAGMRLRRGPNRALDMRYSFQAYISLCTSKNLTCTIQSNQVRHFYKKLYFNPGLCWDPVDTMGSNVIKEDVTGEMMVEESVREVVTRLNIS